MEIKANRNGNKAEVTCTHIKFEVYMILAESWVTYNVWHVHR